jgi:hypothetical protein
LGGWAGAVDDFITATVPTHNNESTCAGQMAGCGGGGVVWGVAVAVRCAVKAVIYWA